MTSTHSRLATFDLRAYRSHYFQQLTLSVCLSVTPLQIASSLFLDGIEPFLAISSPCGLYKTVYFSIFDLGPLMRKIYSPKFSSVGH